MPNPDLLPRPMTLDEFTPMVGQVLLADCNPQQFLDINHAKDSDFVKETINVYLDQSKIILPVLK